MRDNFRDKFAEIDTPPLIEFRLNTRPGRETKPKSVRNVDRADCPECGKEVGLYVLAVRNGYRRVLGYRRHVRRLHSGRVILCRRSNTEAVDEG